MQGVTWASESQPKLNFPRVPTDTLEQRVVADVFETHIWRDTTPSTLVGDMDMHA